MEADMPKPKTIVKNGKRIDASRKGKNEKAKPPKAKPAKGGPDDQAKKKQAIAKAVWKATKASRTTIGRLAALVDTFEEYDQKAENLKDDIGGLKGQIAGHRNEIRTVATNAKNQMGEDAEKALKKLAGLERDLERWEVKMEGLKEQRAGAREAMKVAMADMRKIIKEGPGLFEKEEEPKPAGKSPPPPSSTSGSKPSKDGQDASSTTTKTAAGDRQIAEGKVYILSTDSGLKVGQDKQPGGLPTRVLQIRPSGRAIVCNALTGENKYELDPANYKWEEVEDPSAGKRPKKSAPATTPTSADTKPASSAPAATAAAGEPDPMDETIAQALGCLEDEQVVRTLKAAGITTLRHAADTGRTAMVREHGLQLSDAQAIFDRIRDLRVQQREKAENLAIVGAANR